jgi:NADH dehydrogenase
MPIATVFGGSGFLGGAIVKRLAQSAIGTAELTIEIPTRHTVKAGKLRPLGSVGQIVPVPCSVTDPAQIAEVVRQSDIVINLIGILYEKGRSTFDRMHVEVPRMIAGAARQAGVKQLVHISAIGADPRAPSRSASSKGRGETAVREAFPDAIILRPSIVFGPGDGFFNLFGRMAQLSPVLPLIGGGTTRFQPVYVGDVADAVLTALHTPEARGKTFELGGPRVYTFEELLRMILAETGQRCTFAHIPFAMARMQGFFGEFLPKPPLTRDQVEQLRRDNVVMPGMPTLSDLGIAPTALEAILPTYMEQYRPGGRFGRRRASA